MEIERITRPITIYLHSYDNAKQIAAVRKPSLFWMSFFVSMQRPCLINFLFHLLLILQACATLLPRIQSDMTFGSAQFCQDTSLQWGSVTQAPPLSSLRITNIT